MMRGFKKERIQFLIATDVAARGIDVEGLSFVIQHQLPDAIQYYTHRSGRTARAGRKGVSLTLIEASERGLITKLEQSLGLNFKLGCRPMKKILNQGGNVLSTFTQRRERNSNHVEPMKEVFAKAPF